MMLRAARLLVLLVVLLALARSLARAGISLNASSVRDFVDVVVRHVAHEIGKAS